MQRKQLFIIFEKTSNNLSPITQKLVEKKSASMRKVNYLTYFLHKSIPLAFHQPYCPKDTAAKFANALFVEYF